MLLRLTIFLSLVLITLAVRPHHENNDSKHKKVRSHRGEVRNNKVNKNPRSGTGEELSQTNQRDSENQPSKKTMKKLCEMPEFQRAMAADEGTFSVCELTK